MPNEEKDYARDLIETLIDLEKLHTELAAVIDRKIECMRQCDAVGMNECTPAEQELASKIGKGESQRRMVTDRLARSLGVSPQQARRMTADELAGKLSPARGAHLQAVAGRLRTLTTRIARRNHVAGALGGRMLIHMDAILSAMTAPQERSGEYSPVGRRIGGAPRRLFETVG